MKTIRKEKAWCKGGEMDLAKRSENFNDFRPLS